MKSSFVALVCLQLTAAALADEQPTDLKVLEGTWKVAQLEAHGNQVTPTPGMPDQIVFRGDKATFLAQGRELPRFGNMLMMTDVRVPQSLTFIRDNLELLPCLFEVIDDELKLAMPMVPTPRGREVLTRPESFDSIDKPVAIMTLKRIKQ
jgi:uncharacterized protein (TIGR03067 family)